LKHGIATELPSNLLELSIQQLVTLELVRLTGNATSIGPQELIPIKDFEERMTHLNELFPQEASWILP
jgi:hypothetical protein